MKKLRILCIPGGGLKGTIPAVAIENFSKTIDEPIWKHFDYIFGESTGAILGSLYAAGIDPRIPKELYLKNGSNIFSPQNSWIKFWRKWTRPKYDRERVLEPLRAILKNAGVESMRDLKTNFMCGAVDCRTKETKYFKSFSENYKNIPVAEIIKRSFAAPMYFGIVRDDSEKTYWGDNGTGANNNPLLPAFFELIEEVVKGTELEFYMFGTGYSDVTNSFEEISKWENVQEILDLYMADGETLARIQAAKQSVSTMVYLSKKLPNVKFFYYDVQIPKKMDVIDGKDFIEDYVKFGNSIKF